MTSLKTKIATVLICVGILALIVRVYALEYKLGVEPDPKGQFSQWVEYGNFYGNGSSTALEFNRTIWMSYTIVEKKFPNNATFQMEGEYYNSTTINGTTVTNYTDIVSHNLTLIRFDVETGRNNMSSSPYADVYNYFGVIIIAANLTQGDNVTLNSRTRINSTEVRTYADHDGNLHNRTVNIINITRTVGNTTYFNITVYDQITGFLVEANLTQPTYQMSFSALRVRFEPPPPAPPETDDRWLYYVIAAGIIIGVIVVLVIRRKMSPYVDVSAEESAQ